MQQSDASAQGTKLLEYSASAAQITRRAEPLEQSKTRSNEGIVQHPLPDR